jgi:thiamine-monophosphate kinase
MIDELSALRLIEERFHKPSDSIVLGIGDDAAAVNFGSDRLVLSTADSQVEDVHFVKSLISPSQLSRKAVAVSVSDIGAMGGVPRFILATVGFSKAEDEGFLENLISGFIDSEKEFGVELIGGNLSSSGKLFIDITVLGEVEPDLMVKRSGACQGDLIFASGTLGDSALGLKIMKNDGSSAQSDFLQNRHLCPAPRLRLGRELALKGLATSMIDISDGLLLDLERISVHKGLGAAIDLDKLPRSEEYDDLVKQFYDNKFIPALSGGEDYELLFTSNKDSLGDIQRISEKLEIRITEIGKINNSGAVELFNNNREEITFKERGFVHFNS